jgi:cyclopropane-fatty-acyl-phospholipid synthase
VRVVERLARRAVTAQLQDLEHGSLVLRENGAIAEFGDGRGPRAEIDVHNPRFYGAVAFGGHLGAAEAYAAGWWDASDLTALVRIFLRNRRALDGLERGWARLAQPLRKLLYGWRRNTRTGSRRNIEEHYDLGNDFFEEFLDPSLTYSCGIFEGPSSTLQDASLAKYDRICRKAGIKAGDHILEIGTGWGGFAIHAALEYGCHVTTTTISREQYALARKRVIAAGLADRVTVLQRDYRDLEGTFDKVVSIEMIEAIGHEQIGLFYEKCASLLRPDGAMVLQSITIQDRYYDQARRELDFIKRYIFPGSCIPSIGVLGAAARDTDLRLVHAEDIGVHYAETLRRWQRNFRRNWDRIGAKGFSREFRRIWDFYFSYCEGGFLEGTLGDLQLVYAKPRATLRCSWPPSAQEVAA